MSERIISAEEARRLRDAATQGPWEASPARDDGAAPCPWNVQPDRRGCNLTVDVWGYPYSDRIRCDAELIAAAPDLAYTVEHLTTERDALRATIDAALATPPGEPRRLDMTLDPLAVYDAERAKDADSRAISEAILRQRWAKIREATARTGRHDEAVGVALAPEDAAVGSRVRQLDVEDRFAAALREARRERDELRAAADPVAAHIAAKHPHVQPVRSFDLLRDAIRHIAATGPRRPLWAAVSDAVPHGSGVSASIAVALGLNPDETVGRVPPPLDEVCPLCGHDAAEDPDV